MTIIYKYHKKLLTIEDQREALTSSCLSYYFARANVPGSDFKTLQTKACENPYYAYIFAKDISGADIKYCQRYACKKPCWAYNFARDISGADINYCQKHACKGPYWSYWFALIITKSDKEYCFKNAFPEEKYGPDRWKSEYKKFIMKKACE